MEGGREEGDDTEQHKYIPEPPGQVEERSENIQTTWKIPKDDRIPTLTSKRIIDERFKTGRIWLVRRFIVVFFLKNLGEFPPKNFPSIPDFNWWQKVDRTLQIHGVTGEMMRIEQNFETAET